MATAPSAAGLAALSVCESILLSLTENRIITAAEAKAIPQDAADAHREAARINGATDQHAEAADLLDHIIVHGNSVRYTPRG